MTTPTQPISIVALGDSITHADNGRNSYRRDLWNLLVEAGYPVDFVGTQNTTQGRQPFPDSNFDPDHEARWGWRTDEILNGRPSVPDSGKLSDWLTQYTPDVALVHLGSNDAFQGNSAKSTIEELRQVIQILRADNPNVTIFLAQIISVVNRVSPVRDQTRNERVMELNALIPALVESEDSAESPVILVDQFTGFDAVADNYDGVHPNLEGEAKMAARWFEALDPYLDAPKDVTGLTIYVNERGVVVGNAVEIGQQYSGTLTSNTDGLSGEERHDIIRGTRKDDIITGGRLGRDHIDSGGGDDTILMGIHLNVVDAGDGNNVVRMRDDSVLGKGRKIVTAGDGDDYIATGQGNDNISPGGGDNIIYGGGGKDRFRLSSSSNNKIMDYEEGEDLLFNGLRFNPTRHPFKDATIEQGVGNTASDTFVRQGDIVAQLANTDAATFASAWGVTL